MNENSIDDILTLEERWILLKKNKRKNLDKMKKINRSYVKAKLEKKRINREVKELQARVLNRLYESLSTPGYLILGEVETPTSNLGDRLECLDNKARIYKKVTD